MANFFCLTAHRVRPALLPACWRGPQPNFWGGRQGTRMPSKGVVYPKEPPLALVHDTVRPPPHNRKYLLAVAAKRTQAELDRAAHH